MSDETSEAAAAFERHEAFEPDGDRYRLTTTVFDAHASASAREDWATDFEVVVRVPTLGAAVADDAEDVGEAVASGWLDTFERRLEDAPGATRSAVDLDEFSVTAADGTVTVRYGYSFGSADRGVEIAKTFVEFVEGTYVEGVVPGYEYESPVTDLLSAAGTNADGERGGTPL